MKTQQENITVRLHQETPRFLFENELEDGEHFILETIDGLIDVETEKPVEVYDAICTVYGSGYEVYELIKPIEDRITGSDIDNYLAGGSDLIRISGPCVGIGKDHLYQLDGVVGYFIPSEETAEELIFIPLSPSTNTLDD